MVSIVMVIGGALANALAFTGSSYLFHRLSAKQRRCLKRKTRCSNRDLTESLNRMDS